ncbi:MAG: 23S rRNA (guanosine(2251)-2'-O)-methyltransferase RlmB [bacterium]|nr:23S rRNA (guanosine(2251)-2'-O)-methyltransferase RlmB [bacterium]
MEVLFGKNNVMEAIEYKVPLSKILIADGLKNREEVIAKIQDSVPEIPIIKTTRKQIEMLSPSGRAGNICAVLQDIKYVKSLDSLISIAKKNAKEPLILALDEIQDPRNFGAIIRTALAAGYNGIIFPKHRQVGVTGIVATTSAGACFKIPLCEVTNLSRALDQLKESGFWVYGSALGESIPIYSTRFNTPLVLVIGSEGKGIRRLTKKKCDEIVSIPISGKIESLNASVAAGIIMFEIKRQIDNL